MRKYVYAALMLLYIGLSITTIKYASRWMEEENFLLIASKARDTAILTAKNFKITDAEVEELKKLNFMDIHRHPVNLQLADMFNDPSGYQDIRFVYVMVKLEDDQIRYHITKEYEKFYGAKAGMPLNLMWLADVVVGKTPDEVLAEDPSSYDDIRRYSYSRPSNEAAFVDKKPFYDYATDEYGAVISGMAPVYTTEGTFVGMMGIDIHIEEFDRSAGIIQLMLLLVFLLPSVILTALYILLYVMNVEKAYTTALTDPLTSVKNRRYMEKYLPSVVRAHYRKRQPLSVIMIDIDHFKAYNDNYGHQQGDNVLVQVTKAVNSVLRDKTDTICRYGGEEFLIILTDTKPFAAEKIARRIKSAVHEYAIKHEHSPVASIVTISQGVYSAIPLNTDSEKTFIERADKGLYQAKNTGRDKYVFYTNE